MSKEINKNNLSTQLAKAQIVSSIFSFLAICSIFYISENLQLGKFNFIVFLGIILFGFLALFEYNKRTTKNFIDNIFISVFDKAFGDINAIQNKNRYQKENFKVSSTKIQDIQDLIDNLLRYSQDMKNLTDVTQKKTAQSLNFTNTEHSAVKTNIEKMFSIRHKIQTIAELILELSDFVQSISSTIGLVEDIAEQTNLLALNAAVEAARAGEHGKGFAVVASEIRKLADESKQATTKIISLINDIQQTANSTVLATEEGTKEIESGLELAHIISENIEQLINVMNEISSNMREIIVSSTKINDDSKSSYNYVKEVSKMIEDNNKIVSENDTIFEKIESTSSNIKSIV